VATAEKSASGYQKTKLAIWEKLKKVFLKNQNYAQQKVESQMVWRHLSRG
jgi:hypothetical protein